MKYLPALLKTIFSSLFNTKHTLYFVDLRKIQSFAHTLECLKTRQQLVIHIIILVTYLCAASLFIAKYIQYSPLQFHEKA